jgi:hypothetical protein
MVWMESYLFLLPGSSGEDVLGEAGEGVPAEIASATFLWRLRIGVNARVINDAFSKSQRPNFRSWLMIWHRLAAGGR